MRVAIHTKNISTEHASGRQSLIEALQRRGIEVLPQWNADQPIDMLVSIGGDGTLLNAVHLIGRSGVPVVGINFGHLGFLTTAGRDDIEQLADCLREGRYTIEQRTMLEVSVIGQQDGTSDGYLDGRTEEATQGTLQRQTLYALNEVYLHRMAQSPLLHTQVEADGQQLGTYAADGLIVATPTGSTAYSLSCGGPILAPGSGSLVITPIAAHTLTQRPIVLSDNVRLRLCDLEPDARFTLGVDSYVCQLAAGAQITIHKADYTTQLVRIGKQNFFSAIREKLMWGM